MPITFKPDHIAPSKHFRERTSPIKYIIIHASATPVEEQLKTLDELGLSAHYIISTTGELTELLPPEKVAFHAGLSSWQNSPEKSLNDCSIGIEIETPSLGQTKGSYKTRCMRKLYLLLRYLTHTYQIRKENILGHSDIAPTRKPDPGLAFPWHKLSVNGLAVWYSLTALSEETDEIKLLQTIGYNTTDLPAARYAFCRHFIPQEIFVETSLQQLLDNPYPKDFTPKDQSQYQNILRAVAYAYEKERTKHYWYLKK